MFRDVRGEHRGDGRRVPASKAQRVRGWLVTSLTGVIVYSYLRWNTWKNLKTYESKFGILSWQSSGIERG